MTDMLADGTVTAMKIADGSVTFSKLGGDITTAGKAPLDISARLPAVDVSPLTNLPAATCLPAGTVMLYAGANAPTDWLLCFGQMISRTAYAALFAAISVTHGAGDSSTTFSLPDLRGRVVTGQTWEALCCEAQRT